MLKRIGLMMTAVAAAILAPCAHGAGKARHVVVMVWDGMRPDFVTESNTPTLYRLLRDGVWFDNHHPVYLSATEVNGTAIATGDYPADDGVIANHEYRPAINPRKEVHTELLETVRKGDEASHGHYLLAATTAEILRQYGLRTVVAGAKPVALLHDRASRSVPSDAPVLFAGETLPTNLLDTITAKYGPFPDVTNLTMTRNDWTTEAVIDPLWSKGVPEFTLLWMNQPDVTQHETGPGSKQALEAIKNADDNLKRVMRALEENGVRGETDVLVVSDHGFSTVLSLVDIVDSMKTAGFHADRELSGPLAKGEIFVVGNGGSVLFYVTNHDRATIRKLIKFLQGWSYTGVIFSREAAEGTFTLHEAHIDAPGGPDVMISMRWTADKNDTGTAGMMISDIYSYGPGQGMHGTLSRFDMHNTLAAAGPDFRAGVIDHLPTGNVDVAPTVLWILGVKPPKPMDGRVLTEALTIPGPVIKSYEPGHLRAAKDLGTNTWHQYLNFTEVNGVMYYDEGNGYLTPK